MKLVDTFRRGPVGNFETVNNPKETAMPKRREAGQALIFTSLALVALMGFAGLAIDVGVMRYEKRLQQTAADAAAIAGANNLANPASGGITTGAQDASTRNGFTDNGGGLVSNCTTPGAAVGTICVEVNNPPKTGPHSGDSNYVETLVAAVHPTYFMKVLSINSETITARAVAANLGTGAGNGCLYTMGLPTEGVEGLNISGNATLNAPNCGIVDDGNYITNDDDYTVIAYNFGVAGNSIVSGRPGSVTCITSSPCPTFGIPASSDPLQNLPAPPVQSPSFGNVTTSGTQTLFPGTYNSISIGAGSTVTLNPGIYYVNGSAGVSFAGPATVLGSGVMFYFTNGASINTNGGGGLVSSTGGNGVVSNIQLSAPTTGTYAGILFFQDSNDMSNAQIGGDNSSFFNGALYFPEGQLTFFGSAGGSAFNIAIADADAIVLGGNVTVNLQGSAGLPAGVNLVTNATIVE